LEWYEKGEVLEWLLGLPCDGPLELDRVLGAPPSFPRYRFLRLVVEYNRGPGRVWRDRAALEAAAETVGDDAKILGHIDMDTAKVWLAPDVPQNSKRLYTVGYGGRVWYCTSGGCAVVREGMAIVAKRGALLRFPYEDFAKARREYEQQKLEWTDRAALEAYALGRRDIGGCILGHIGGDTAKKWLGWPHGGLYAVGHFGEVLFCLDGGILV
jgi:hypothetical protein